jgi:hypothetical protein
MNATQTTTSATIQTPTCAVAYFAGYSAAEAYAFGPSSPRQVVLAFSRAVAAGRVAKVAFRAFAAGWTVAETLAVVS